MAGSPLSDADLHGIVDGHIEAGRRLDVLKRLTGAPADRARVEAWQEQTDMLRNAFLGVEREVLPANLDLAPKPRLRCVSSVDAPISFPTPAAMAPAVRRGQWVVLAAIVVMTGAWLWWTLASGLGTPRAGVDDALRARVVAGLGETGSKGKILATVAPDLSAFGFSLAGVEAEASEPATILVRYRDATDKRLVIGIAYGTGTAQAPARRGDVYLWRDRAATYAMNGTIAIERLHAIAAVLQAGAN